MKVLVCGGRDFNNRALLSRVLDNVYKENLLIIHGAARGADLLAEAWAIDNGIPYKRFPADWNKYGKRAGYLRNVQMLNEGQPDLVVAFPGGAGTAMMISLAKSANVKVIEVNNG